ncbi:MAG: ParB N-terminal domain-containing protein [Proteobacteria bacterium]|nr:ParB N-terminal domain-containing protein [Pseudomonadota bacterium]
MTMTRKIDTVIENGTEIFVPLNKLKKSPRNARRTPHGEAAIEALAGSIAVKGMLQNLVVEPETKDGVPTGCYFVTVGEGRRLAQLLRAKRKQIKKTEPIRCVLDTANDPHEISLDENVTRSDMHPADQFEAFRRLNEEKGWGAEEIAARFGVTPHVVRQRLRLGAISPRLMQAYREGGLTLDQLMAFALSEDHARQEQVYDNLSWNKEPQVIRRMMTETHVSARDRRAVFVGAEAYAEAGGTILRDLFAEDSGGYFEDAALLDRLAMEKLAGIGAEVQASEGWKWAQSFIDYPHAHGLARHYPEKVALPAEDQERLDALQAQFDALTEQYDNAEELPDDVDEQFGQLEAEIERLAERQHAYAADVIARGGVFVVLNHDGTARIERGFVRPEDDRPSEPEEVAGIRDDGADCATLPEAGDSTEEDETDGKPLSDVLVRDLTAHRTLGLRLAMSEQPDVALVAVIHALAARTFYHGSDEGTCLDIRPTSSPLGGHADGIEDTAAAKTLAERHAAWAVQMPQDVADLWDFVAVLDHDSRMALFAHCAALTVFAVRQPWDRKPRTLAMADKLVRAVSLDMAAQWTPTVRSYLGRITKVQINEAVREAVSDEAATRIKDMKKQPMAEAAEQLLAGTGWLPALLRTPDSVSPTPNGGVGYAHAAE